MSTFDIRSDAPGLLRAESINVTIKFDRTGPTTGRISWNIPAPAPGCSADTQAYCGMVVTLDTTPASADKIPQRGQVYSADATADSNLFAGDKLGTALVIGAFYEDRTTTFLDVAGLKPNTPYYVSGFPVDRQLRYFIEGVHAYSLDFTHRGTQGTNGTQIVVLNADAQTMGVNPDQYTGLDAAVDYEFTIKLGLDPKINRTLSPVDVKYTTASYNITITGDTAQTYEQLAASINRQLALLRNAAQGPTAPNTGSYYFSSRKKLFLWDGAEHVEQPVFVELTAPDLVTEGTYWLDTANTQLKIRSSNAWSLIAPTVTAYDPTAPKADITYLYTRSGTSIWNGVTWCDVTTITQATDPSLSTDPGAGSFWYDEIHSVLYRWNDAIGMWTRTEAVQSRNAPDALPSTTYWLNDLTNALYLHNTPAVGWNLQSNVSIAEVAPSAAGPGKLWYKPTTLQLFQRNGDNSAWVEQDIVVYHQDPTQVSSCGLWWDVSDDTMKVWDTLTSSWIAAPAFFIQTNDPSAAPQLSDGTVWFNTTDNQLYEFENGCFKKTEFTTQSSYQDGDIWLNSTTNVYSVFTNGGWTALDPIESETDPTAIQIGAFWFNLTNSGLNRWNGATWIAVTYSSSPLAPTKGTLWFDTTSDTLKEWNGAIWSAATPLATVQFDGNFNLQFTDTNVGSASAVTITDISLFSALEVVTAIHPGQPGTDGASDEPMYAELGLGTDGSDVARNALITDIRYELGYPVMDVELAPEQLDYAIDRALSELRSHSSLAYKRGFFFMSIPANQQRFFLTSKRENHNKIVDVLSINRLTSAFVSSAHGAGVYGQIVVQHLYNMGNFDMLSYHLMAEQTKLMEMLFAGRITYTWNEQTREIFIHNRFSMNEQMVCIEATEERTEQDLMTDRYTKSWIRRYAGAMARLMLSEVRGKFSTLPGAGGSVSLNASDLRQAAQTTIEECMQEIADYVVDRPEEYGMGSTFLFG